MTTMHLIFLLMYQLLLIRDRELKINQLSISVLDYKLFREKHSLLADSFDNWLQMRMLLN